MGGREVAEAEFVQGMTPFLREALGAYGDEVLTDEVAATASGTTAEVGRGLLRATYRRVDERGREGLVEAVQEAVAEPENEDAVGELRQAIRRALRKHPELEGSWPRCWRARVAVRRPSSRRERGRSRRAGTSVSRSPVTVTVPRSHEHGGRRGVRGAGDRGG